MLRMNASSEISSFIIFLLFLLKELSPGLTSLASPLGDPSDGKVEFEIHRILAFFNFFHGQDIIPIVALSTPRLVPQA